MALKGDRIELYTGIDCFMNEVAERGGIACASTVGSGSALDQAAQLVTYASTSSGAVPVGLLLNDMVNIDLTRQHPNWFRDEVQKGGKVTVAKYGFWVTNLIIGSPARGDAAVVSSSGYLSPMTRANQTNGTWNRALNPYVGEFLSSLDEDGYAKVEPRL